MPAVIPARPTGGAVVDTAWGQDVHDRVYMVKGIAAGGNALAVPANALTLLDMRTRNAGNLAWLAGDNQTLRCPTGHSGWYVVELYVSVAAGPAGGSPLRVAILRDGAAMAGNTGVILAAGVVTYLMAGVSMTLNDGQSITAQMFSTVAVTATVVRCTLRRVADNMATT
jgi:hypothetical protein